VSKKYLALTRRRSWVCTWVGVTQLIVGLDVNSGAFAKRSKIVVLRGVEGNDVVPGNAVFHASAVGVRRWRREIGCCNGV